MTESVGRKSEELERLLQRHEAFWRSEGGTPLVSVIPFMPLESSAGIPLSGGRLAMDGDYIRPGDLDPRRFFEEDDPQATASPVDGDFLSSVVAPGLCWTEAMVGCPVRVGTGGAWAEPFLCDVGDIDGLGTDRAWLGKLIEFTEFLSTWGEGRRPVGHPLMRGPIDMMAAALGHEELCLAFVERPAEAETLLGICAGIFLEAAETRLDHVAAFWGGYVSDYGLWAPGSVLRTQVDNAVLFSPSMYEKYILPYDRKVIERFQYPLIHLHSGCLHIVDSLLDVDALKAIQVVIDYPGGPLVDEVLPTLKRMLVRKPLIVTGAVSRKELESLLSLTPVGGLCIQVQVYDT